MRSGDVDNYVIELQRGHFRHTQSAAAGQADDDQVAM
jgi:hypothetical protein